ncbi:hypothetical protein P43SY_008719 [Pythium insidiosum]|uniref:Reverse transcriptase n=1 Tax=Pythium insidiosum TaxID=114742 RepID=A0AAD5LAI5_PYTIN|nr:hypothetical protein P43SY_008719 [Pythium insidiosum]
MPGSASSPLALAPATSTRLGFPDAEDEHKSEEYHTSGSGNGVQPTRAATVMKVTSTGIKPNREQSRRSTSPAEQLQSSRTPPTSEVTLAATSDPALQVLRDEVNRLLRPRLGWLARFDAAQVYEPAASKLMLHNIILDDLSVVEQIAVFQSVMVDAGISFINLVPAFARRESEFAGLAPPTVQTQLFEARWAITAMVARYTELRRTQAPAIIQSSAFVPHPRTVEGCDANPYAMRKASSVISSSHWSQLRLQAPTALPPAQVQTQPAFGAVPPAFATPTPVFVQPATFPNPVYPSQRPPTVDEPMEQAPDYFPGHEPAHAASQPAFGMPEYAREPAHPAQGHDARWQVPCGYAPPAYARPFIPFNSLEKLSGTEPLADRRIWWEEYKYLARAGSWTDMEKCEYLRMYLTKSARLWYKQLLVKFGTHRLTWKKLAAAFKEEFLESNESAFEKYCYLSQAKNETPRQYLWRLNVAAKEAGISIREPVAVERHVTRYVSSLRDPQVRSLLLGASFGTVEQLEMQLRLYERRSQVGRDDGAHRDRGASKARDASTYIAQHQVRSEAEYESDDESQLERRRTVQFHDADEYDSDAYVPVSSTYQVSAQGPVQPHRNGPPKWKSQPSAKPKWASAPAQAARVPPRSQFGNANASSQPASSSNACFTCACGPAHNKPEECPTARILEEVKAWYKAGNMNAEAPLPASVLQHLNFLDLARQLGLELSFKERLKVKGVGDITTYVTARARVKITLGVSVVYYMDIWCGNIGEGIQCLLGMDFMVSAGVRLSAYDGMVRLPEEESVRLANGGLPARFPKKTPVSTQSDLTIGPGSELAPTCRLAQTFKVVSQKLAEPASAPAEDAGTSDEVEDNAEVYYHEGTDYVHLDVLRDQLAELPQFNKSAPPADMRDADAGEYDENTPEELAKLRAILEKHQPAFISSGNALPPPAGAWFATSRSHQVVKGIDQLQFPTSLKGIQSFLGSLNYYHKFIEDYSVIASCLYELTEEQIKAGRDLERPKLATLQDAELRYHESEKEVLALLRVLKTFYTLVAGHELVVYTRFSVLKWIMTSKTLADRLLKWATFLSPWTFEVRKVDRDQDGLAALFAAGITPREKLDEIAEALAPVKASRHRLPVVSLEMLDAEYSGYLLSFDGAAKLKTNAGSASFVLWRLPEWEPVHAQGIYLTGVTVNEAEYHGMLYGLRLRLNNAKPVKHQLVPRVPKLQFVRDTNAGSSKNAVGMMVYDSKAVSGGGSPALTREEVQNVLKVVDPYVVDAQGVLKYVSAAAQPGRAREQVARLVVPPALRDDVMHLHHSDMQGGHQGISRTYERLRAEYYWREMYRDVERFVTQCEDCATAKGTPPGASPSPGNVMPDYPMHIISMDFVIPLPASRQGSTALLLFQDMFSGYIMCKAMKDTSAQAVAEAYEEVVFRRFGASSEIRHDRDPRFMSEVFRAFAWMMKSQQRATLAYRPQANGQQERSVQSVVRTVKAYVSEPAQEDWEDLASRLVFALNTSLDATRRETPFFLMHGWDAKTTMAAMLAPMPASGGTKPKAYAWRIGIQRQYEACQDQARQLQARAKRARASERNVAWESLPDSKKAGLEVGDAVWLYIAKVKEGLSRKLAHHWHGPFRIVEKNASFMCKLHVRDSPYRLFPWVHISRLKPRLLFESRPTTPPADLADDDDFDAALLPEDSWLPDDASDEYEVEELLDVRWRKTRAGQREKEYLVKWRDYAEPTWEPLRQLNCSRLLHEFNHSVRGRARFAAMQVDDGASAH